MGFARLHQAIGDDRHGDRQNGNEEDPGDKCEHGAVP
jgi:hypothetical protein